MMVQYQVFEDLKAELAGWDVESVAAMCGVAPSTMYFWLAGKTKKPRIDTISKVADAIGFELQMARKQAQLRLVK